MPLLIRSCSDLLLVVEYVPRLGKLNAVKADNAVIPCSRHKFLALALVLCTCVYIIPSASFVHSLNFKSFVHSLNFKFQSYYMLI
jgi:hypothetical protein